MIEASPWLSELETRIGRVRERAVPEDVHQLRVATRRLASWLRLGSAYALRDDLRWLRRVAGAVRDVDVVLDLESDPSWVRWLRQLRKSRHQELLAALASERTAALMQALASLPEVAPATAQHSLRKMARRALAAGDDLQRMPEDVERFHRLRRSVRALRYGLEWLDEKTGAFRSFQEVSGLAADRALALQMIDLYPDGAALAAWRAQLDREFAEQRHAALEAWTGLRGRVEEMAG